MGAGPGGEWFISVDDHVIEPPHVWVDRLPAKHREAGPRWVSVAGKEGWRFEEAMIPVGGAVTNGAVREIAARPSVWIPLRLEEIAPACYDPKARLAAMDEDHELAALLFPNLPKFAGTLFLQSRDKELARLCVEAYNDWMLEEWCATAPGRFIPLVLVPLWDPNLAAAEVERTAAMGARAVSFPMAPHRLGLPFIADEGGHWDPLFSAVNETGLPLCTHLGTGSGLATSSDNPNVSSIMFQLAGQETLADWLTSGLLERYPHIKVCLSEGGMGWIPAVLQTAEWLRTLTRDRLPAPTHEANAPSFDKDDDLANKMAVERRQRRVLELPSPWEQFRDHVYGCFIDDPHGLRSLEEIGVANVMLESDFPHNASWWPETVEKVRPQLAHLSDGDRHAILRGNAERVFDFTPSGP